MNLARHREIAMAATATWWSAAGDDPQQVFALIGNGSYEQFDSDCQFIAANSPEVVLAFIALAEADDPEPNTSVRPRYDSLLWAAWKRRQELRAALEEVVVSMSDYTADDAIGGAE